MNGIEVTTLLPKVLLSVVATTPELEARLLDHAGLQRAQIDDADARIPLASLGKLWELAVELTGNPRLGLHVGERLEEGAFGVIEYIALNATSLRDSLEQIVRYARLLNDTLDYRLVELGEVVHFRENWPAEISVCPPHGTDLLFAAVIRKLRRLRPDFSPLEVRLMHTSDEAGRLEYERVFGCRVAYGQIRDEILFARDDLNLSASRGDARLRSILTKVANEQLKEIPDHGSLVRRVGQMIERALRSHGEAGLPDIARALHLSPRTLQRKLGELGASYQSILGEARKRLAVEFLTARDADIEQVSHRLGFSEPSAFIRSFKRWFGTTPGRFRRPPEV